MAPSSAPAYQLRPNKAVDRELFLSLLLRLSAHLKLNRYHYIGMGGPLLEDFRLIHARLGIIRMTTVDDDKTVHKRPLFNRPTPQTKCVLSTIDNFLDTTPLKTPVIAWLDFTSPNGILAQIERYASAVGQVPIGSVLRITLNANPTTLGDPPKAWTGSGKGGDLTHEWRLGELKRKLGRLAPAGLTETDITRRRLGPALLQALEIAVANQCLGLPDRKVEWAFSTHYADGQAMVTATLIVCKRADVRVRSLIDGWGYATSVCAPHVLDLPALSTRERLTMEASKKTRRRIAGMLGTSDLGAAPLPTFETFYRMFPHFTKVDL